MKKYLFACTLFTLLAVFACNSPKTLSTATIDPPITPYEQHLIDSVLQYGLDHEALYTLLADIKPMSSLVTFYLPIANDDSTKIASADVVDRRTKGVYLDKLRHVQQALNKIDLPGLRFVLVPYQAAQGKQRIIQLSVLHTGKVDSLLQAKESFFGQYGLVPGADPVVVNSVVENADRFDRNRAYGYLFGYPDYAVDFFTEETVKMFSGDEVKAPTPRSFFQIPVYAGNSGYFVYAYPKDHEPTMAGDSLTYYKALHILEEYKAIRDNYLKPDSTLNAYQLLQDFYRSNR